MVTVIFTIGNLKKIFHINDYSENFLDGCFKLFLNRFHAEFIRKMFLQLKGSLCG